LPASKTQLHEQVTSLMREVSAEAASRKGR